MEEISGPGKDFLHRSAFLGRNKAWPGCSERVSALKYSGFVLPETEPWNRLCPGHSNCSFSWENHCEVPLQLTEGADNIFK